MSSSRGPTIPPKGIHLRTVLHSSWTKVSSRTPDDDEFIRRILEQNGIQVDAQIESELFRSCAELQAGKLSSKDFCDLAKTWLELGGLKKLHPFLDFMGAITDAAEKIQAQEEANELSSRYLSTLETARGLAPESVKVVVAVKEVVETGFDDHEVTYLSADSLVVRSFIQDEIAPFFTKLQTIAPDDAPMGLIRRKRQEVKEKLEMQLKNVNIHLQRAEAGINLMHKATYYIKSNHLPRYAAASALEVVLRAYYVLLGSFDPEDIMIEQDWENLQKSARERCQNVYDMYLRYSKERISLVTTKYDKHTKHNHSLKITDAGSKNDHIFSKFDISAHANQYPRCNAHEQGKTSKHDDDSFEYYNNGYNRDLSTGPGLALYEEIIYELRGELSEGGPVWERTFQPHIDLIETILQRFKLESGQSVVAAALSQPLLKLKPVEVSEPPLPKPETMPLKDWMRGDRKTDIIQGWVSREDGPSQEASKELLAAVICRGWGVVTIGHYNLGVERGFVIINGKEKNPSKHMLEVLIKDESRFTWRSASGNQPLKSLNPIPLGQTADGQPLYLGKTEFTFKGLAGMLPGVVGLPNVKGYCSIVKGSLYEGETYEVLCAVSSMLHHVPEKGGLAPFPQ